MQQWCRILIVFFFDGIVCFLWFDHVSSWFDYFLRQEQEKKVSEYAKWMEKGEVSEYTKWMEKGTDLCMKCS